MKTDSEQVPRGKGEKQPGKGDEIDLKPYAYKESERCYTLRVIFVVHVFCVPIQIIVPSV